MKSSFVYHAWFSMGLPVVRTETIMLRRSAVVETGHPCIPGPVVRSTRADIVRATETIQAMLPPYDIRTGLCERLRSFARSQHPATGTPSNFFFQSTRGGLVRGTR